MYIKDRDLTEIENRLGHPRVTEMRYEIHPWEYDVVDGSMADGRAHDVTMFIRQAEDPRQIALIRKPFFPPGAFRAPSGAAHRGETLEQGALREAREETGLDVELTRYLVRINATFTCDGKAIEWTTHIFEARQLAGELDPIDTEEIAEARWGTVEELQGPIRDTLLETGWQLFRYRVALTDLTVRQIKEST